jgi:TetR/AcrR family transcriptional regulator of autoinduction and epiphytic fitness
LFLVTLSDRKREAILKAASDTFRKDGFYATTMDTIAERAGVSKRTVYNHFPSKDVLFDVVTDAMWSQLVAPDETPPEEATRIDARLRGFIHHRLGALLDPELIGLFRVVLGEQVRSPELARAYMGPREKLALLGLRELLAEETTRGRLHIEQLELASTQMWGLVLGPLFWPLVLGLRTPPDETERQIVVEEAVTLFLARYGVRAEKPKKPKEKKR